MPLEMTTAEKVTDLHARFARVERAILGDPTVGHVGLVARVEVLEKQSSEMSRVFYMVMGSMFGGALLGGGSVWAFLAG